MRLRLRATKERIEASAENLEPLRCEACRHLHDRVLASDERLPDSFRISHAARAAEIVDASELTRINMRQRQQFRETWCLRVEEFRGAARVPIRETRHDRIRGVERWA